MKKIEQKLDDVRKSLEKCRKVLNESFDKQKIDFLEVETHKFKSNEDGDNSVIKATRNTKTCFYVWPIFPTFEPYYLNRILDAIYDFFPNAQKSQSHRNLSNLFEWDEEGGINTDCEFSVYEPLAKTTILSEVIFLEQGLKFKYQGNSMSKFYDEILYREIKIILFACKEIAEKEMNLTSSTCLLLYGKERLEEYKKAHSGK